MDLPLIWAGIIALAVLLYVVLDGFDLGVGILFPFAKGREDRDVMIDTIAPVWDGNETWLVLGGGGLFAAFPYAYAALAPALYLPLLLMLLALILRGVAFEFRLRGRARGKAFWTFAFSFGSAMAAVGQGFVLGGFIQGVELDARGAFAGGPLDWLTPYTALVAAGLVCGYALLGAGWLIWRTQDALHDQARRWARIGAVLTAAFLAAVSLATLKVHPRIAERWGFEAASLDLAHFAALSWVPGLGAAGLALVAVGLMRRSHGLPFLGSLLVFVSGYVGLAIGFFPYVAPYTLTFREAASADNALALMLGGVAILLPMILGYMAWSYWVFRGKVTGDAGYHH